MLGFQSVMKQGNFERGETVEGSYGKICTGGMKFYAKRRVTYSCCFITELFQLFEIQF